MTRGEAKTGTFYWNYRTPLKNGRKGQLKYSPNFRTKEQAYAFRDKLQSQNKWYSGNLYFVRSLIDHGYIE